MAFRNRDRRTVRRQFANRLLHIACTTATLVSASALQAQQDAADSAAAPASAAAAAKTLPAVTVIGRRAVDLGPLPGLSISVDQVPANLQNATAKQIKASGALSIGDYMNTRMQGVSINNYAGNPFQMDVNYRGFTASPQVGTPQGLSVFFDGVRVNEPFGDVVNWDLIPLNAIERFDLFPGSNPLFGLNTLGGAISVRSKNGFTEEDIDGQVLLGSWGRRQTQLSVGGNNGTWAGFGAINLFNEDGWRDDSPSKVRQFYGRVDRAFDRGSLNLSLLAADNRLVGNGLIPIEDYRQRAEAVFTSPDEARNRLTQWSLGGDWQINDRQNITGRLYHRRSERGGLNGDIYEGFDTLDISGADPSAPGGLTARNGAYATGGNGTGLIAGTPIGLLTTTALEQTTDGLSLQANWNLKQHSVMVGVSIDRSKALYRMSQRLGLIDAAHRVYGAPDAIDPAFYAGANDVPGNNFVGTETTRSLFASETWSPRPNVHITGAARYNHTRTDSNLDVRASDTDLHELLTGTPGLADRLKTTTVREGFRYTSFNPSLGINWLPVPELNLYGNLSRGARVPSVVELGCAFDSTLVDNGLPGLPVLQPRSLAGPGCSLPTTLSGDPYLPQIRSTSGELGGRGKVLGNWYWNFALFRTDLKDDIYFVGVGDGKSYFDTVGKTRRQGLELGLNGMAGPVDFRVSYAYTLATFESTFYTVSAHNSSADFDQNSQSVGNNGLVAGQGTAPSPTATANQGRGTYLMTRIDPGARMPGVPLHALSGNLSWEATGSLTLGLGMVVRSSAYVRGNENNAHAPAGTDQQTGLYYCGSGAGGSCSTGLDQLPVRAGRPFTTKGSVPGYAIFNLDASYEFKGGIELLLQVSNLFNRKYVTAGRLGVNPFSASVNGARGASGWNYNSAEWQNTSYVGPGAPRGIWLGLNVELSAP